jgi:perosamine synthetase
MTDTAKRFIPIARPAMGEDEWHACRESILAGWITQGPKVAAFEKRFSARHGASHAIACSNCTTGLHLILAALGIGPGDEVLVPSFTWVATANAVCYTGATPVLVDVDRATYNLAPADVAAKITGRTRAVIVVHLFGLCADVDAVHHALGDQAGRIDIIEDAACATGATCRGRCAGTLGRAAAFSFHPRKSVTTGEGGMVVTNDADLAEAVNRLRNHGASISEEQRHQGPKPYLLPDFGELGFNYRMTDLQASVGLVQLEKLDGFLAERRQWAAWYDEQLADVPWLRTPTVPEGVGHAWQSYVTYVDEALAPRPRNDLMEALQQAGISTRPGTHAVHMLGYYRNHFGLNPDDLPATRDCDRYTMAIPLHNCMTVDDFAHVVETIKGLE